MKPEVLDLRNTDDPRDAIHRAVQCLAEGGVMALPTETVYGLAASGFVAEAVERLRAAKGRADDKPLALSLRTADEAREWVPRMGRLGRRLARRCWPGPVTLVFDAALDEGRIPELAATVRQVVVPRDAIGIRVSAHSAIQDVIRLLRAPLVLSSANRAGQPDAVTAQDVLGQFDDELAMVLDDGPCRYGRPSTVVRVFDDRWEVLREGVVPARSIERLASCLIVFVCTGNTCRSPMAEGIAKTLLAQRLGCAPDELAQHGFQVVSAGLSAVMGSPPTPEALEVVRRMGVNIADHLSQPLTATLIAQADYVFTMTEEHRRAILAEVPDAADHVDLLNPAGEDIDDPIGGDFETYQQCARQIEDHLIQRVTRLEP